MKTKIQLAVAILVILAAAYWAFTATRTYTYTGSNIMFPVGSGHVVVTNPGDAPIPIEMRSGGRIATFRIESREIGLAENAKRIGTGRDAFYSVNFDLPPGQTRIDVARGSEVNLITRADTRIEAKVTPLADGSIRWILIASGVLIAGALYYMSSVTQHQWLAALRGRLSGKPALTPETTKA
jgi:hypothetical protein